MKCVVDEDLPRSFSALLKELGHEVFDVRDHGLRGKPDEDIFRFAQQHGAVLFSADLGFANIVQFPLQSHFGIVVLRFSPFLPTEAINSLTAMLLDTLKDEDYLGNLVILSPRKIRIRRHA